MSKITSLPWDGKSTAVYAHIKIDGSFLRVMKDDLGEVKCYSSLNTDLTEQIRNCKPRWLINLHKNLPLNSSILGELYYFDLSTRQAMPASYIKTGLAEGINWFDDNSASFGIDKRMLGRHGLKGLQEQQRQNISEDRYYKQLCFSAFAIEFGFVKINESSGLEYVREEIFALGVEFTPFVSFRYLKSEFPSREKLLGEILTDFVKIEENRRYSNAEGWMLKNGNLTGWKKAKKEKTIDCFITGFVPGLGKYAGQVGSLKCSVYNAAGKKIEIATVGGFNDEIRDWLTVEFSVQNWHQKSLEDTVIEVQYQFVASKGRLRHGRFKRWREDKLPEECLTNQDEDLIRFYG